MRCQGHLQGFQGLSGDHVTSWSSHDVSEGSMGPQETLGGLQSVLNDINRSQGRFRVSQRRLKDFQGGLEGFRGLQGSQGRS